MDTDGKLYLGRIYDTSQGQTVDQPLLYDPPDLTTHGIVVGMTGSGKTGLCLDLLEEAALQGVPALMIDPKGDITNAILHFPDLLPEDFLPWINADEARRSGKSEQEAAADTAALWTKGLADWNIQPERIQALKDSARFAVFTPGSDAGIPVSILASLKAPSVPWEANRETLREQISATVTSLLGLVGMTDIDPVRSREHILLANIFEQAWSSGRDLSLGELIMQVQSPPFEKLGVFDINTFFPEKDRFALAMLLNNILAAPSFQAWIEGQPLDVQSLLYTPDGRPRHSIFYIAHLNDAERMFFVTLLFSAVETWMRAQTGTTSLRALLYFDEIFGYLPPVGNPASKPPMLRLLKQARAFGVGLLLATQNPVDVDYKALSNAGTWFIGKLQTDQDKQRLLDGLQGAAPGIDRGVYDQMLSSLGKRVFLAHNVHEKKPALFQTRWAMNYLAGPLTRTQIPALNELAGAQPAAAAAQAAPTSARDAAPMPTPAAGVPAELGAELPGVTTRPAVPARVEEYVLPNNLTITQAFRQAGGEPPGEFESLALLYRPALLGQVSVRYLERKYELDVEQTHTVLVPEPDRRGFIRWEDYQSAGVDPRVLSTPPDPRARYLTLEAPLNDAALLKNLQNDLEEWVYRSQDVKVKQHSALKLFGGPQISPAEFRKMCAQAAQDQRDAEIEKVSAAYKKRLDALETKLTREQRELIEDESEYNQRKMEEMGTHLDTVASLFSRRKKSLSSSLSKRRMTEKAKADVEESREAIQQFEKDIDALEKQMEAEIQAVRDRWGEAAMEFEEISVPPKKTNIHTDLFGVAWMPVHLVRTPQGVQELPGYRSASS